jgi:glycosyltransferase involved in cell wall biosynthesis
MINITAPINNLGYGIASYNIIKALFKGGQKIRLHPIGAVDLMVDSSFLKDIIESYGDVDRSAPCVKIWHQNDIHHHVGKGMHVGFPIFELDSFKPNEVWSMKHNDRLFVCSQWAKDIIGKHKQLTDIDVNVVPLGVDTTIFKPKNLSRDTTIFLNCGKWEVRKGHDILVECFNNAFTEDDDVELWMMCENPFQNVDNNQWINLYKKSAMGHKIRIIPRQQYQSDVYNIMSQADCGVFPARAEGWNLELLEMMACGKTVIATNYSAHTEFCNNNNCLLVDISSLETAFDGVWFFGDGLWASIGEAEKSEFANHMRNTHELKKKGDLNSNVSGIKTAEDFSWNNSAQKFMKGLLI